MTLTYTIDEISNAANKLISYASKKNKILLFNAEMGVGKTTLIKEICKQLGVEDTISSPTYSLVNQYQTETLTIFHFDFYRIQDVEEVYDIGFEEYIDYDAWIFIEWPEKITELLPKNASTIHIKMENDGKRTLLIS